MPKNRTSCWYCYLHTMKRFKLRTIIAEVMCNYTTMKLISLSILFLLCQLLHAQTNDTATAIGASTLEKDTITPQTNKYGDLLNDDPFYNPKYAWWIPSARVVAANAFNWALAKYFYKFD